MERKIITIIFVAASLFMPLQNDRAPVTPKEKEFNKINLSSTDQRDITKQSETFEKNKLN